MKDLLKFDDLQFGGKLAGMPVIFTQFDMGYVPTKLYSKKFQRGSAARTQDIIYDILKIYKGTISEKRFCAETKNGYVSEFEDNGKTIVTKLSSKGDIFEYSVNEMDENDILKPVSDENLMKKGIILSLMPLILSEKETHEIYDTMSDFLEWDENAEDWLYNEHVKQFAMLLNQFSTNFEIRYMYPSDVEASMVIPKVEKSTKRFRQEDLKITTVKIYVGKARKFVQDVSNLPTKEKEVLDSSTFEGSYAYNPDRIFTEDEKKIIAKVPAKYVMPDFVPDICEDFKESTVFPAPMRVAYLVGPAGTGKTEAANAIFAGLGLPGDHYTCNPGTEIFDFIGQVFPNSGNDENLSFDEIREKLGLPNTDDCIYDPAGAYEKVFGVKCTSIPDPGQIIVKMMDTVMKYIGENVSNKNFKYVESGLIKAARMGYGFEIQEIGCVLRPGVAVGLNALLETGGNAYITLPTGEVIKKHPDCTIIFTSNDEYEGCCNLNQSVLDRMALVHRIENPPKSVMKERILSRLNFPDEKILERMIDVIYKLSEAAKKKGITDGVCGYRSLENWCMRVMIKSRNAGFISDELVYTTAIQTVLNKVSQKSEYVEELMQELSCKFAAPKNV